MQCNQVVFQHGLQLIVMIVLTVANFQCLTNLILGDVHLQFEPTVNYYVSKFCGILLSVFALRIVFPL